MDLQAQDRVHRIGQTKPVLIYRLTTTLTVESLMLDKAARKRRLEQLVISRTKFKGRRQLLGEVEEAFDEELIKEDAKLMFGRAGDTLELSQEEIGRLMDRGAHVFAAEATSARGRIRVVEEHHSAMDDVLASSQQQF